MSSPRTDSREVLTASVNAIDTHIMALSQLYKRWTTMQLTVPLAERLAFLPEKYLPDVIKLKDGKITAESLEASETVWEAFNEITNKVWHGTADIRTKTEYTDKVPRSAVRACDSE